MLMNNVYLTSDLPRSDTDIISFNTTILAISEFRRQCETLKADYC